MISYRPGAAPIAAGGGAGDAAAIAVDLVAGVDQLLEDLACGELGGAARGDRRGRGAAELEDLVAGERAPAITAAAAGRGAAGRGTAGRRDLVGGGEAAGPVATAAEQRGEDPELRDRRLARPGRAA